MPVSLDTLKRLVADVHELRSHRQYDEADRKRDKLVRMGVRPPDYCPTRHPRANGARPSLPTSTLPQVTGGFCCAA